MNIKSEIVRLLQQYQGDVSEVYKHYDELRERKLLKESTLLESYKHRVRRIHSELLASRTEVPETANAISVETALWNQCEGYKALWESSPAFREYMESFLQDQGVDAFMNAFEKIVVTPYRYTYPKPTSFAAEKRTNVLILSDVHYGEVVNPEQVNNLNDYNTEIAKDRIIKLFDKNLAYARETGCENLELFVLGDIFSGIIHDELVATSEKAMTEHLIDFFKFFAGLVLGYAEYFKAVRLVCVVGNHGRLSEQVNYKQKSQLSFEYLFYKFLQDSLAQASKNITTVVPETPTVFHTIGNIVYRLEHGDHIRGSGMAYVDFPISKINRSLSKNNSLYKQSFDVAVMGHFHKPSNFFTPTGEEIFINGSIVGPNEFSIHALQSSFPPVQYALIQTDSALLYRYLIYP